MTSTAHNIAEYSVSEISAAVKRVVEEKFGYVRVRGEVSGWRGPHASGHCYFALKDDKAKIDAIIWKGVYGGLRYKPEEGMEVIASGRLTTYPGKSGYQIVIEALEPAGEGALMALLEKRRKALAAEGLFDESRKQPLPWLPESIGVITSPTGAVIRDILHRLADRFPCHVLVWPVAVQGEGAAAQIAAAIEGMNGLLDERMNGTDHLVIQSSGHRPAKPDLLIVARGGGSIEDLWPFNEEIVVRAAAASKIPLISAVGHETDTTLIDHAADVRAPTPTAAAEMAVPVLADLLYTLRDQQQRIDSVTRARLEREAKHLDGLARGLPRPMELLGQAAQRLDGWAERLQGSLGKMLERKEAGLREVTALLRPAAIRQQVERQEERIRRLQDDLSRAMQRRLQSGVERLESLARQLALLDYHAVLKRGFALVRAGKGGPLVTSAAAARGAPQLAITFQDGEMTVGTGNTAPRKKSAAKKPQQESLF